MMLHEIPDQNLQVTQDLKDMIPINPLAQQSSLVQKMDLIPHFLPHTSFAVFWQSLTDHFQYYDQFFTSLHTLPTPWSKIPFQQSWLIYNVSWQDSLPNASACLGMLVINKHEEQGY